MKLRRVRGLRGLRVYGSRKGRSHLLSQGIELGEDVIHLVYLQFRPFVSPRKIFVQTKLLWKVSI